MKLTEENEIAFEIMQKNKMGSSPLAVKICGGEGKLVESAFQKELNEINSEVTKAVKSNLTENWFGFANYSGMPNKVEAKEEVKGEEEPAYLKDKSHRNVKPKEEDLLADLMGHKIGDPKTGKTNPLYQKAMAYIQKGFKATDALKKAKSELEVKEDVDGWKNASTKKAWMILSNDEKAYNATLKVAKNAADLAKKAKPFADYSDVDWEDIFKTFKADEKLQSSKVESLINLMLDKSLMLAETTNIEARKVAYFLSERFIPTLETLVEAKEDDEMEPMDKEEKGEKEEKELSPEEAKKVLEKVQKGLETLLSKVTDEEIQKDIQKYIDTVEDILEPEEDEEEGEKESEEPKEIEEAHEDSSRLNPDFMNDVELSLHEIKRFSDKVKARLKKDDAFNHETDNDLAEMVKLAKQLASRIEGVRRIQKPMFKPDSLKDLKNKE